MNEQRCTPRVPVRLRSVYTAGTLGGGNGMVVDLSRRGCKMVFSTEIPEGTRLEMHLQLTKGEEPLQVMLGVVRWSKTCECGIEFVVIDPDGLDRLDRVLGGWKTTGIA